MTERAVPSDSLPASNVDKAGDPFDEKGAKPDRYGEWLDDNARIWRVYERLAKQDDEEKVKRWSGGLNNLALFATLFAGITTAFIIESQADLKPDYAELAYRVQIAILKQNHTYVEEPFVVPGQARTVNCLWITSLLLSLAAALIAVMGSDWVEMYVDKPVCNPRQWAEIRSFRLNGVYRWRMPGVIATAPVLLHASLFLFGIGLSVFMASDAKTQVLCIALCAIIAFLYLVIMLSPVLWSSSPFRSPATMLMRRWFCASFQRKGEDGSSLPENAAIRYVTRGVDAARRWLRNRFSMHWATFDIALEIYGPHVSSCAAVFRRWSRRQDSHDGGSLRHIGAVHDPEAPSSFSESQHTASSSVSNLSQMISEPMVSCYPRVSDRWMVSRRWRTWIRNAYTNFRTAFRSTLDMSRPDFSRDWSRISETPSPALLADSLSWLSSASSSPEVTQVVIAGLCDHVMGSQVAEHANAQRLLQKLSQYADGHWERMNVLELSRYVIITAYAGQEVWPDCVTERLNRLIDADTPLPPDFLLALVHAADAFRSILFPLFTMMDDSTTIRGVKNLCKRIPEPIPIALSTWIASTVAARRRRDLGGNSSAVKILCIILNQWCDALPPDIMPLECALREMFHKDNERELNKLTSLCNFTSGQPIDNILHLLIVFFIRYCSYSGQSTRDLALSLARAAPRRHYCLAAMFGNDDPAVTQAAWSNLPAHEIEMVLLTCHGISACGPPADVRPMLARMIARCIRPPFPLLAGNVSAKTLLFHGQFLSDLVDIMSRDPASQLPDDLFLSVLENGALADLATFIRDAPDGMDGRNLLLILEAVALWITAEFDFRYKQQLFDLFTRPHTTPTADGAAWDFIDAIGTVLEKEDVRYSLSFYEVMKKFLSAMMTLREVFPSPECTLWESIVRKFAANKHRFGDDWLEMCDLVEDTTGIDPDQFATEDMSRSAGSAIQGDDPAPGSSTEAIQPMNESKGVGTLAHPMPEIAWIAAGATPEDGI